jgi:simple sugar transport system substrate-binding protein
MTVRACSYALALAAAAAVAAPVHAQDGGPYSIATVVKLSGVPWFDRMEEGVERFNEETPHEAFQVGPAQADAALQVQMIQDLLARDLDAITVVPFSPEAVIPVLNKAQEQGIVVVTHEASNLDNVAYDLEAFQNDAYGEHFMKRLAECMNEEGQYAVFVGSLTSKTHNQWVDAAIAYQKEHYPNMELVGSKNETYDDQQRAYQKTQELLRTYPDIAGFQGSASTDTAGIGLAVEQAGLQDRTCVVGTSLPSISGQYLETGAVDMISFWDPALAGYAMNKVAVMVLDGKSIETGDDLGIEGYESVEVKGNVIYGEAWVDVTAENMDAYPF